MYELFQNPDAVLHEESRNGPVLRLKGVVSVCLLKPWQRVNFCPARDANPFFHLIEAIAMLVGYNSVQLMAYLAKNMASFSDDGVRYNAFYGTRARSDWGDQLHHAIRILRSQPDSRQAVVQLWDPYDLTKQTKDKACNLSMLFHRSGGQLCLTSFNRSNDAILGGVSGANIVHLSMFQEYVACALGLPMGPWWHVSNNLHVYVNEPKWPALRMAPGEDLYRYDNAELPHSPILKDAVLFDLYAAHLVQEMLMSIQSGRALEEPTIHAEPFLAHTVVPVWNAWLERKNGNPVQCEYWLSRIDAADWRLACYRWYERRLENPNLKS